MVDRHRLCISACSAASFQVVPDAGGIKLMARSVRAAIVRLGLTPRLAATTEPSQTYMFLIAEDAVAIVDHAISRRSGHGATAQTVRRAGNIEQDLRHHAHGRAPASLGKLLARIRWPAE